MVVGADATQLPPVYDPTTREFQDDPYPIYRGLLTDHPVYHNECQGFYALSRFGDVELALDDWVALSSAQGVNLDLFDDVLGPELLNLDPPRHGKLREIIAPSFTPRSIARLEGEVQARTTSLLSTLAERDRVDWVEDFASVLPVQVICHLLGVPEADIGLVRRLGAAMLERDEGTRAIPSAARAAALELHEYFAVICQEKAGHPYRDLITLLANAQVDGARLPEDEMVGMCMILYSAGNTTTTSLLSSGMWVFEHHPDERRWLARHPTALRKAVEELVRYESPVQYTSRVATRGLTIHGVRIEPGERVVLVIGAANRDPRRWDEPDRFDVRRPVRKNLAFGHGVHTCVGAFLARMEARIVFEAVLRLAPNYGVIDTPKRRYFSPERGLDSLLITLDIA